jgi:hypothetical protein
MALRRARRFHPESPKGLGWTNRGEAGNFRSAAAATLQKRLKDLVTERRAAYQAAQAQGSRALIVVDRKQAEIARRFRCDADQDNQKHGA